MVLSCLTVNYAVAMMCGGSSGESCHNAHQHKEKSEKKTTESKIETKESFYVTVYTCPMHPEIQQEKPSNCPKCGMKLEKKQVLMTYACPEKDCEYQKANPGKCLHHDKDLVKCEVKYHCPKCGKDVEPEQLLKPKKGQISLRNVNPEEVGKKVFCPVMKKEFTTTKKTEVVDYEGKSFYLCCAYCEKAIIKQPEKYISICPKCEEHVNTEDLKLKPVKPEQQIETKQQKEKIIYTCSMCGGEFDKPGKCPKCGMELIPVN
ncbi:MAG: heavy metal-binding domain-containing protein [Candidatus Aenigmatarchaeota archaeon]